jgi:hypothetical protein
VQEELGKKIDLTGQRFGKWTVLGECEERTKDGQTQWECLCDCGNKKIVRRSNLRSGSSKSCGCMTSPDITGQRFGKWTVIGKTKLKDKWGAILWDCLCECGTRKNIAGKDLKRGNTKGCMDCSTGYRDLTGERFGKLVVIGKNQYKNKHGHILWRCECECGNEKIVESTGLRKGKATNCGQCGRIDLIGKRFGKLLVQGKTFDDKKYNHMVWKCTCECGNEKYARSYDLINNNLTSCGQCQFNDYFGKKFGKLVVLGKCHKDDSDGKTYLKCKCECGNMTTAMPYQLKNGVVKSCGCIKKYNLIGQRFGKLTVI